MENLISIRDAALWWLGNWAMFTLLDSAILGIWWRRERRRRMEIRKALSASVPTPPQDTPKPSPETKSPAKANARPATAPKGRTVAKP